ncbi:metal-dependent hydrolase [Maritimibacter alkaliphilus]|uniref:metal-dependent hydrolase n=1 Tax=Maritimibacter alkaliphilus TaxID=404236 RepID=UPI001C93C2A5|nr:metal-dependent hydrolase [Maritimibacter alkaliphilus]MBY6090791.1 metal-dependent hydrolase [Maritimibacter alkaliphilus]
MKIIWLGHGSFRLEIEDKVLLIDPFLTGNPVFPDDKRDAAIKGATHIFCTHGHGDHVADVPAIAEELDIPVFGMVELMGWLSGKKGVKNATGFNKGGTIDLGNAQVTMVNATHSSSTEGPDGPIYLGSESGFMISGEGHTIYFSGDTDVMADMGVFNALHEPDIGILCAGGHYTMDMKRAAYAAKTFFDFKTVIPMHYKTFPALEQSAEKLAAALPGVAVIEPEVMTAIEI